MRIGRFQAATLCCAGQIGEPLLLSSVRSARRRGIKLALGLFVWGGAWSVAVHEAWSQGGKPSGSRRGLEAFETIASVLQHPRCLNCHQPMVPLQGEGSKPHVPSVLRGADGLGVSAMRCTNCNRESNNHASGVPGAPNWKLAPASMSWAGLSRVALCRTIKDPKRNGGLSLQAIVNHLEHDELVLWGWNPGNKLASIPISHTEFVDLLNVWVTADAVCPS